MGLPRDVLTRMDDAPTPQEVGLLLRRWREDHGYTQAQVGEALGMKAESYREIELGRTKPSPMMLALYMAGFCLRRDGAIRHELARQKGRALMRTRRKPRPGLDARA